MTADEMSVHFIGRHEPPARVLHVGDYWNGRRWTGTGWDSSEIVDQAVTSLVRSFEEEGEET